MKTLKDKLIKFRAKLWKKELSCTYLYWVIGDTNVLFHYHFAGTSGTFNIPPSDFDKYKIKELVRLVRTNTFQSI